MSPQVFRTDKLREHVGFATYLIDLEQVADAKEADLVSKVLTGPSRP
jgi:hypothetical protein